MHIVIAEANGTTVEFQIGCTDAATHFASWLELKGWRVGIEEVPHANPPRRTGDEQALVEALMAMYIQDPEGMVKAP